MFWYNTLTKILLMMFDISAKLIAYYLPLKSEFLMAENAVQNIVLNVSSIL